MEIRSSVNNLNSLLLLKLLEICNQICYNSMWQNLKKVLLVLVCSRIIRKIGSNTNKKEGFRSNPSMIQKIYFLHGFLALIEMLCTIKDQSTPYLTYQGMQAVFLMHSKDFSPKLSLYSFTFLEIRFTHIFSELFFCKTLKKTKRTRLRPSAQLMKNCNTSSSVLLLICQELSVTA